MGHFRQFMTLFLTFLLLAPSTILLVDAGGKTTSNLCRGCHGENYGAYVTLSQFSVPAEVGVGEVFDVSVRMILSGNLDQSIASYWRVDTDVTLSSAQNRFSFSPATYTYNDKLPGDVVDITWQLTADQGTGTDTLTVSVYAIAQHFSRTGSDQISLGVEVMPPNNPPQLSQPSFSPAQGDANQLFDFEVIWSDSDGDMPSYLRLIIDGNSLPLSEANPGAEDPLTGARFVSSSMTLSPGHHTYFFQGSDGEAGVRLPLGDEVTQGPNGPLTGVYPGPFVGSPPALDNDSLSPLVGDDTTNFTYSITLLPSDNPNGTMVSFWLDGIDSSIQPVVIDLGAAGWRYDFTVQLSAGVNHFHHFTATNSFGSVRYPGGIDSLVGPVLVGDVLSDASLSPTQGNEKTLYTFSINYSNPAAIEPSSVAVVIDGNTLLLNSTATSPDWMTTTQFATQTLLDVGNHNYHFEAFEGGRSHRVPEVGEMTLPVMRFDSDPWLESASILVNGTEIFNSSSVTNNSEIANLTRPIYLMGTEVEMRITYRDAEGDEPLNISMMVWIDGIPNLLQRLDSNDSSQGQVWGFTTTLTVGDNHTVYFTATSAYIPSGSFEGARLREPLSESTSIPLPTIAAPPPPNVPPLLQPPSDGRLMLDPFAGAESDNYSFLVEVVDADWMPENQLEVWLELDGELYTLQPVGSSDHLNGTLFGITLQLSEGEHSHRFGARDIEDETTYPESGMVSAPTVQANMIPVGELGDHRNFISWAWWLVAVNLLLILCGLGWAGVTLREARKVVYQRGVRKMAKIFSDFKEESNIIEENSQKEISDEVWRTKQPDHNLDSRHVSSTVDADILLTELGGVDARESPLDSDQKELLDELQIDDPL